MSRFLPYPLLTASLILMWLLLNSFSLGHLILGTVIAVAASWAMAALQPDKPRLRRWHLIPVLIGRVLIDIYHSNVAVSKLILQGKRSTRRPGFVVVPLRLRDRTGLAVLACILTATPGTAWVEYHAENGRLLIHVLDLVDGDLWIETIQKRYEQLLMEVFE
ncbi:Na+/H+ antiporter subunit E [Kaistia sp. 32K]|uniref:Na+/H+ antiporter subunit E n=1 Tax=Kaistia sp. 32K TaxID=2795690 RepID=UPI0019161731|nr:Na+/H+ antiporter subunit E [Kaistia sp. 32K]BCP52034.1 Na+/H+ antiporter subunit E [Kaistia sp. 32K]